MGVCLSTPAKQAFSLHFLSSVNMSAMPETVSRYPQRGSSAYRSTSAVLRLSHS